MLYDAAGMSSGICAKAFDHITMLLTNAAHTISSCKCNDGCPSCKLPHLSPFSPSLETETDSHSTTRCRLPNLLRSKYDRLETRRPNRPPIDPKSRDRHRRHSTTTIRLRRRPGRIDRHERDLSSSYDCYCDAGEDYGGCYGGGRIDG